MLVPLLAATEGSDPHRLPADGEEREDAPDQHTPGESVPLPPESALREPEITEPESLEEQGLPRTPGDADPETPAHPSEPVHGPVALVPEVSEPAVPTATAAAVRPTLRDEPVAEVNAPPATRSPLQRAVVALLLIAAAALIGYALSRPASEDGDPDTLARSAEAARELQLVLDTDDLLEARRFVRTTFGWRVGVPVFEAASLRGVAVAEVTSSIEVPVLLYANGDNREIAVFLYSYALLDQVPERLTFARADFDDLSFGEPVIRQADGTDALLWRDRDDIYVAITDIAPEDLRAGLTMAR